MTTQSDRKTSRNPMEMGSDVTFQTFGPFLVIWGLGWPFLANFGPKLKIVPSQQSFDHSKRSQEEQNPDGDGSDDDIQVISGHFVFYWGNILTGKPFNPKNMFVSDIDIFQKETKCTFMKTSFKLIV